MEPVKTRNLESYDAPSISWEQVARELFEVVSEAADTGARLERIAEVYVDQAGRRR